jgi:hypothetical protein
MLFKLIITLNKIFSKIILYIQTTSKILIKKSVSFLSYFEESKYDVIYDLKRKNVYYDISM